ncbi:MAG: hypothetical protein AABX33_05350 [Nanoarchaeota archaeon]
MQTNNIKVPYRIVLKYAWMRPDSRPNEYVSLDTLEKQVLSLIGQSPVSAMQISRVFPNFPPSQHYRLYDSGKFYVLLEHNQIVEIAKRQV